MELESTLDWLVRKAAGTRLLDIAPPTLRWVLERPDLLLTPIHEWW